MAQRAINVCNSLSIQCIHLGLKHIAFKVISRAYKIDLIFAEIEEKVERDALQGWRGRLVMLNTLTYLHMTYRKDLKAALATLNEGQKVATKMLEATQKKLKNTN